ncbi:PEP-CTERM sorting domain-containing protein [Methylophilus sp. 'Pure River']|uniref:PEP-CTERM sorting domain-containing protein n=1 Tax=Methylophilus sp. 'Pure River' TaxID=3377117 RepID=UPI00398F63F3
MLRLSVLSCLLVCLPLASHASAEISLASTSCSGDMSLSAGSGISLACTGNLSLDGGWLKSDSLISVFAGGDLTLNNLSLYAPEISLSTLSGNLTIGSNVLFDITHTAVLTSGATPLDIWSPRPVIAWQAFNIGLNSSVVFNMGAASSSVINRITEYRPDLAGSLVLTPAQSQMLIHESRITLINSAGINVSAVPEPDGYMMILAGLGLMACRRKTKKLASGG